MTVAQSSSRTRFATFSHEGAGGFGGAPRLARRAPPAFAQKRGDLIGRARRQCALEQVGDGAAVLILDTAKKNGTR
jgi:hypothetical protein